MDLADYLLKDDPKWTRNNIREAINSEQGNIIVRLSKPVPVHLLYWTAWVDSHGGVNFRDDIYRRDSRLDVALRERPPGMGPAETRQLGTGPVRKVIGLRRRWSVTRFLCLFDARNLPVPDRTTIQMDKIGFWIVTDTTSA